jgi:hypothetical protein
LRLIEDDGEVIATLPDSTAIVVLQGGREPWALTERVKGKMAVTDQAMLATAIVNYLSTPGNIDHIIAASLPRKKQHHRHN